MILELGDGRELKLPDDMDEEIARQLGKLILATEQRAADAEQGMQALREELQALRSKVDTPAPQIDLSSIAAAVKESGDRCHPGRSGHTPAYRQLHRAGQCISHRNQGQD